MAEESPLHRRTVQAIRYFATQTWKKILGNFFSFVAATLTAAVFTFAGYLFGASSVESKIRWTADKYGAHCLGDTFVTIRQRAPELVADDPTLDHMLACHGPIDDMDGDDRHVLTRLSTVFNSCFDFDENASPSFTVKANSPTVEPWKNSNDEIVASCQCDAGQARLIARHKKSWCGADPKSFEEMSD